MHQVQYKDRMRMDNQVVHEHQLAYIRNAQAFLFTNVARKGLIIVGGREFTPVPTGTRQFRLLPGRFVMQQNGDWVVGDVPNEVLNIDVPIDGVKYNVWLGYDTRENGIGKVDVSGTAVTGTSTFFTREYRKGQYIAFETDPQVSYKIASVDSDTAITLVAGPSGAITEENHYLAAAFYEDTPAGSDTVYIRQYPYYTVTLEGNTNAVYSDMILVAQIRTDATSGVVELIQDYRSNNQFKRVPLGDELQLNPATPLNVKMETGVVSRRSQKAWIAVTCGWSGDTCTPSELAVDVAASLASQSETLETDALIGHYFEDSIGNLYLISGNTADGSTIELDGTPQAGEWKIHPGAIEYELYVNMINLPPPNDGEDPAPPPRAVDRVNVGGVAFSPTAPEVVDDNYTLGAEYKFRLKASNGPTAKSEWSDFATGPDGGISIVAGQTGNIPAAPANITLSYNDDVGNFTVVFDTVNTDTDGDPADIDSYEVAWKTSGEGHELPVFFGSDVNWISNITGLRPIPGASSVSTTFGVRRRIEAEDVEGQDTDTPVIYVSAVARARATDGRAGAISSMATSELEAQIIRAAPAEAEEDTGGTVN